MKIFGFAGWSGSGKTTLIERLIPRPRRARGAGCRSSSTRTTSSTSTSPARTPFATARRAAAEVLVSSSRRYALMHELRGEPELTLRAGDRPAVALRPRAGRGLQDASHPQARDLAAVRAASRFCTRATRRSGASPPTCPARARRAAGCPCSRLDAIDEIATFVLREAAVVLACRRLTTLRRGSRLNLRRAEADKAVRSGLPIRRAPASGDDCENVEESDTYVIVRGAAGDWPAARSRPNRRAGGAVGGLLRRHLAARRRAGRRRACRSVTLARSGLEPVRAAHGGRLRHPHARLRRLSLGQRHRGRGGRRHTDRYSLQPRSRAHAAASGSPSRRTPTPPARPGTSTSTRAGNSGSACRCTAGSGYAQTEIAAAYLPGFVGDVVRRNRDGVNYGLGLRYDMTLGARPAPRVRALRAPAGRARQRRACRRTTRSNSACSSASSRSVGSGTTFAWLRAAVYACRK